MWTLLNDISVLAFFSNYCNLVETRWVASADLLADIVFVTAGCPYKVGSQKKSVKETCFIDRVTEHLSIEILTPPTPPGPSLPLPTPSQGGGMWGVFMVCEGTVRPWWVGDFSGFALHMHLSKWRSEVEIWLVPSFLTVISSGDILREILRLTVKENYFQLESST